MRAIVGSAVALVIVLGAASAIRAEDSAEIVGDMIYTFGDGSEYTFHDDGTFECVGRACPSADVEPFEVILGKNKIVVIEPGGRWHEKQKGELIGTKDIKIKKAFASATGKNIRIDLAEAKAKKGVRKKIAAKVVAGTPKRKLTAKKVLFCMDQLGIAEKLTEKRDPKTGWTITAAISLNREQILRIVDCAERVVEVPKEEPAKKPAAKLAEEAPAKQEAPPAKAQEADSGAAQ